MVGLRLPVLIAVSNEILDLTLGSKLVPIAKQTQPIEPNPTSWVAKMAFKTKMEHWDGLVHINIIRKCIL